MPSVTRYAIPGGWTEREIPVGPHAFRLLTPADPDEFLNHLVEPADASQQHLADPYWAKLWPAAALLAEAVLRGAGASGQEPGVSGQEPGVRSQGSGVRSQEPNPQNPQSAIRNPQSPVACLELGCGSGLVGIAALAAGLAVTFSDYVPQAVELALENAARNGFPGGRGLVLDWCQPADEQFPFIVAADVTYDRTNLDPLLNVLDAMLAPGGEAWFGDAGRSPAADFLRLALDRGWSVCLFDVHDHPALDPALGRYQRIVLKR